MDHTQKRIINALGVKSTIDPAKEIRRRIDFLKKYCRESGSNGFVLGISGGQDSLLAGKLAQLAVNELRDEGYSSTFVALRLPHGIQQDEGDAELSLEFIQPDEVVTFNIEQTVESFSRTYRSSATTALSDFHKGNAKARTRMMVHYAVAGERHLLVIGADHAAEAVTGFSTKFGDGAADVVPLDGLTKRQGKQLLTFLQAPDHLIAKQPTADLLDENPGRTDEEELQLSYEEIDEFLEGNDISPESKQKIENLYGKSEHKRSLPMTPFSSSNDSTF